MTSRNCENCGQAIGLSEQTYSYLGRVICETCKNSFDKQLQALTGAGDDTETETPNTDEHIEKDKDTESGFPVVAEEKGSPDSQPVRDALTEIQDNQHIPVDCEQQTLTAMYHSSLHQQKGRLLKKCFVVFIVVLVGLLLIYFCTIAIPFLRDLLDSRETIQVEFKLGS